MLLFRLVLVRLGYLATFLRQLQLKRKRLLYRCSGFTRLEI